VKMEGVMAQDMQNIAKQKLAEAYKKRKWLYSDLFNRQLEGIEGEVNKQGYNIKALYPCVGYARGDEILMPDADSRLEMLKDYVKQGAFEDIKNVNKYFIPYHPLGNHWVVFVVEPKADELNITCFDPFGGSSGYFKENEYAMKKLSEGFTGNKETANLMFVEEAVQNDYWQCGYHCLDFVKKASKWKNVFEEVKRRNEGYLNELLFTQDKEKLECSKKIKRCKDIGELAFEIASSIVNEKSNPLNQDEIYIDALPKAKVIVELDESGLTFEKIKGLTNSNKNNWAELIKEQSDEWKKLKSEQYENLKPEPVAVQPVLFPMCAGGSGVNVLQPFSNSLVECR